MSRIPESWPADAFFAEMREAVATYIMVEAARTVSSPITAAELSEPNKITLPVWVPDVDGDRMVGRTITITATSPASATPLIRDAAKFLISGYDDGTRVVTLDRNLPGDIFGGEPPVATAFSLQSIPAAVARMAYFFAENQDRLPKGLTANEMPAIVMSAEGSHEWRQATNLSWEAAYRLKFDVCYGGRSLSNSEAFLLMVWDRLLRGRALRYNLSSVGFQTCDLSSPVVTPLVPVDENNEPVTAGWFWRASFAMTCKMRRAINVLA